MTPEPPTSSRRIPVLIAVVLLGALLASSAEIHRRMIDAINLAEPAISQFPVVGALLFMALAAVSAMFVFVSSVVLVPVGLQVWGAPGSFLLLWAGWALGGVITYGVGRLLGRPAVQRLLSGGTLEKYAGRIPQEGSFLTILLIQLAVPSDVSGYFFGLLSYPFRRYLGALVLAELPYALGTIFVGAAFVGQQPLLLLAVAVIALAALGWRRYRRRRDET